MAERLTPRTLDLEVRGSSHAHRVVSLDKELYYTLSLLTPVYKWVLMTYCCYAPLPLSLPYLVRETKSYLRFCSQSPWELARYIGVQ